MSEHGKEQVLHWLRARPVVRGVLMRGVRFPDKTYVSDNRPPNFPEGALEQAWRVASDTFQVLSAQHFPPTRLSWVYAQAVLHCVQRPDGAMLGIFLARNHAEADTQALNRLLTEFQNMTPADSSDEPAPK